MRAGVPTAAGPVRRAPPRMSALLAGLFACGGAASGVDEAANDALLRLPLEAAITSLDPASASDAVSRRITGQLFDTLVDWDPYVHPPAPRPELLAELPRVEDDGLAVTLSLRRGADARRFAPDPCLDGPGAATEGRPVVASDVAASILRLAEPAHAGAFGLLAGRVVGLDAWREAPVGERPPLPEGITVIDDATLTLRLTRPQPELTALLGAPQLAVVPIECVRRYDGVGDRPPFARHPVGSGPYVLDPAATALPRAVGLRRSPALAPQPYPAPPSAPPPCATAPALDRVVFEHIESPDTALRLFQRGHLAALAPGPGQFAEVIDGAAPRVGHVPKDTYLQRDPVLATTLLVFRMDDPEIGQSADPDADARNRALRRAIAVAFDTARYLAVVRSGAWGRPAAQVVPTELLPAADALHPYALAARDEAAAIALAGDAGLSPDRRRTLRYATTSGTDAQQEAAILREALRPLGLDLEVLVDDAYLYKLLTGQLRAQIFALRFDADYPDPESFLAPFTCASPSSYTGYCSPRFDAAFARFAALPPGPDRIAAAADLERILGDDVPVRPIDTPELWTLLRGDLRGFIRHPLTGLRVELLCRR